jgi:hypothetical protein
MERESGLLGVLSRSELRLPVEKWDMDDNGRRARVYCDLDQFQKLFPSHAADVKTVIATEWWVRLDNEEHLYYGVAKCCGVAKPCLVRPAPRQEFFAKSLVLYFDFVFASNGPFTASGGKAMARNGNEMFMDLLTLGEVELLRATGDVRFGGQKQSTT